ncbi:MEIOTIC F-BOX protein MOF [Aegilops tauschii subsp. strangulata]|nr:MEIOTIC F-BOX protein MOF [Aegilops tauschii subsp. strangulata]XP_044418843.1 MEIOTIC F-BOX protein MOF-like [Triticum aestivum]
MRRRDPIGMDSIKRRRVDAVDRLGDLPDCLLHCIISLLGSRQARQTSVLSRRWRHLWREVRCAVIDEREFADDQWERFEDFTDHMLSSLPAAVELDVLRLHLVSNRAGHCGDMFSDRWVRRGLQRFPATVDISTAHNGTVFWKPHASIAYSYAAAPARRQPDLSSKGLCAGGFTRRLTTLRLVGVNMAPGFVEGLGGYCPVLEDLHVERCRMEKLHVVASPTLKSLTVIDPHCNLAGAELKLAAPRLAYLLLEIPYDGRDCYCVAGAAAPELLSLADASIRLTDTSYGGQPNQRARKKRKLEFLKSMCSFLALIPNVTKLHLSGFPTTALLQEESEEFPMLHNLKALLLERCDLGVKLQALTSILSNTPNLEELELDNCTLLAPPFKKSKRKQSSKRRSSTTPVFWCKKLKSIELKHRLEDEPHMSKILSEISEGMLPAQWMHIKKSMAVV